MGLDMSLVIKRKVRRGRPAGGIPNDVYSRLGELSYREYYNKDGEIRGFSAYVEGEGFIPKKIEDKTISYTKEVYEVAYWRKANEIHKWFVDNVQNGVDDCNNYKVTLEDLYNLNEVISKILTKVRLKNGIVINGYSFKKNIFGKTVEVPIKEKGKVIANPKICKKLLPVQEGFFFGNQQYNEYYYNDLVYTKERLSKIFSIVKKYHIEELDMYYNSSW
jgi:hypothetical protein